MLCLRPRPGIYARPPHPCAPTTPTTVTLATRTSSLTFAAAALLAALSTTRLHPVSISASIRRCFCWALARRRRRRRQLDTARDQACHQPRLLSTFAFSTSFTSRVLATGKLMCSYRSRDRSRDRCCRACPRSDTQRQCELSGVCVWSCVCVRGHCACA